MLDDLLYSINVILPVFLLVVLGFVLGRTGFLSEEFTENAERLVFRVALPVMLFCEVSRANLTSGGNTRLIFAVVILVTAAFLIVGAGARIFVPEPSMRGAFVQGACRSNFAVLGIPLAAGMFGDPGAELIAVLMPFVIIMFNAYSVITLSVFSDKKEKQGLLHAAGIQVLNVIKNPLIIASVAALPFSLFAWELPVFAEKSLGYISELTTPLALICLGANFRLESLRGKAFTACAAASVKTVLLPLAVTAAAAALGFRGVRLGALFILFASPSAVSSYIMAKNMGGDSELAAQILLISTGVCILTVFAGIFILKSLALI